MRPICIAILATLFSTVTHAHAERVPAHLFDLVNTTHDSVISLAIAAADSDDFRTIDFGAPLQGGLTAVTFEIPEGACVRDVRVTFENGRRLLYSGIDVCRHHGLRLRTRDGRTD